jgi:hypothetical protein
MLGGAATVAPPGSVRGWTPVNSYMNKNSPNFIRACHPARAVSREQSRETMIGAWMTRLTEPTAAGRC